MWITRTLVCLCVVVGVQAQSDSLVVHIDQGQLRGYKDADGDIFTFLNVPYATAPSGTDKFKAPLPAPVWPDIFDAVDRGVTCPQVSSIPSQDQCLVADIVVPAQTNVTNLPVMLNVHGGGYMIGSSSAIRYRNLVITQKLIVVTFNYRLGVHGFLCLGTEDVPGNAGMKDQVALFRWVNRNIASFGGNPHDVTIAGCSAGGGSVDLLTLSPMTTGLFHKVIMESGCSIGYTGVQVDPIEYAKTYARALNCSNVEDFDALEDFYITATNDLLNSGVAHMFNNSLFLFTPCVERDTGTGEEMFLSETPWNLLKNGLYQNLPLLYGYANMEGLIAVHAFDNLRADMNANFSRYLPVDLRFECDEQKENVAKVVKELYFGDKGVTQETILGYVDYYTDIFFIFPMLKALELRRNATVFFFDYAFTDGNTPYVPYTKVRGADHCTPWFAVMDQDTTNATPEYLRMRATMKELFLNFIISGNPVREGSTLSEWPPVDSMWSPHMALNNVSEVKESLIVKQRVLFWEDIYEKHYRQPVPPSDPKTCATEKKHF